MRRIWKYMAVADLFMVLLLAACCTRLPGCRIYKVFSYSGLNVRETDLYVIVYRPWWIDREVQGIVSQHNEMNGIPDRLTVWPYYSKYNLGQEKGFNKVIFEYSKNQVADLFETWQETRIYQVQKCHGQAMTSGFFAFQKIYLRIELFWG